MLLLGIVMLISGRYKMGGKVQRAGSAVGKRSFMGGRKMILWKLKVVPGYPLSYTSGGGGGGYNLTFLSVPYKYANRDKIRYSQNKLCREGESSSNLNYS